MEFFLSLLAGLLQTVLDLSPYLLLGFIISGLIYAFIPRLSIQKAFGKPGFWSVTKAGLFGVPLPLCSCGVIPAAVSLRDRGASRGATLAFLITTPETGVDSILASAALLDPIMTVFRPLAAFFTGLVAGVAEDTLEPETQKAPDASSESCKMCPPEKISPTPDFHQHSWHEKIVGALRYAFEDLLADIAGWLLLGLLISAALGAALPTNFFGEKIPSEWAQFALAVLLGVPLYICATASTPIAATLVLAGVSPGAALVFMLTGPATNAATILTVWRKFGRRAVTIYLSSIVVVSILLGVLLNRIYFWAGTDPKVSLGHAHDHGANILQWVSVGIFLLLLLNLLRRKYARKEKTPAAHDSCH